jgi:hypothetical protein
MKRKLYVFFLLALLLLVSSGKVFAYESVYITDGTKSGGEYVNRSGTVFQFSETPYLYLLLKPNPLAGKITSFSAGWWHDPDEGLHFTSSGPSTDEEALMTLSWGYGAGQVSKTAGLWTVNSFFSYENGTMGTQINNFSFAPEPVSSSLFLLGAGVMFIKGFRKRRKV